MRPRVISLNGDALGTTPLDLKHHCIEGARRSIVAVYDVGVILPHCRIRQAQHASLVRVACRGARGTGIYGVWNFYAVQETVPIGVANSGNEDRRVRLVPVHHVNDIAAHVVSSDKPIHSKLLLKTQIPLIDVRFFHVPWKDGVTAGQWKRRILIQRNRERISTRLARPWIVKRCAVHHNLRAFGRCVAAAAILMQVRRIKKIP